VYLGKVRVGSVYLGKVRVGEMGNWSNGAIGAMGQLEQWGNGRMGPRAHPVKTKRNIVLTASLNSCSRPKRARASSAVVPPSTPAAPGGGSERGAALARPAPLPSSGRSRLEAKRTRAP